MRIIRAGVNDLDLIAPLFDKYRTFYKQSSNITVGRNFLRERLNNNESIIFLAVEEQDSELKALGFTQLYPSFSSVSMKRLWILNDLYVDQTARRKGVGGKLLDKAKELAIETDAKGLTLQTDIDNYSAQHLYESNEYIKDVECYHYNLTF
ncbi:GNAT family N-acetyltransferase [Scopulibacillus cellulosilyticus]|uniref:GNAT family N-acetyltransferase n=1 Tax=Scopulibacillus cellulosilyticus TaxID=2665665 RepID=A0ABW2PQR2_9BACL